MDWIVWLDAYEGRQMSRVPLGVVTAVDYHAAVAAAWKKFGKRKWEPKNGRQNITVTPANTELVCVRELATRA